MISERLIRILWAAMLVFVAWSCTEEQMSNDSIVTNPVFTVTGDSVVEGEFVAVAESPYKLSSNYSAMSLYSSSDSVIRFRIFVSGQDCELLPTDFHTLNVSRADSLYVFGQRSWEQPSSIPPIEQGRTYSIKIDMQAILKAIAKQGYFATALGDTLHKQDLSTVQLVEVLGNGQVRRGSTPVALYPSSREGIYEGQVVINKPQPAFVAKSWQIMGPNTEFPQYESGQMLVDALYNMAVEQIAQKDQTLTSTTLSDSERCYVIILSMSYLDPDQSMNALRSMVTEMGTVRLQGKVGNEWPLVSGQLIWAAAAWQVYCVTGDKQWLQYAYNVTQKSIEIEEYTNISSNSNLIRGVSQSMLNSSTVLPSWLTSKDLYECYSLDANMILEHAYETLDAMGDELGLTTDYSEKALRLKDAINLQLWDEYSGRYRAYISGEMFPSKSQTIFNLGQAMSVVWDIADDDRSIRLIEHTPITSYGIPTVYPLTDDMQDDPGYINPMIQAYWNIAAARTHNHNMLRRGLGALYRMQAMGTSMRGTVFNRTGAITYGINPLLGAVANTAMVYRVFAGMKFVPGGIEFNPVVPACFTGQKTISNFRYRDATIQLTLVGAGDDIEEIRIDGQRQSDNFFPDSLHGHHSVIIKLQTGAKASQRVTIAPISASVPIMPYVLWGKTKTKILNFTPAIGYRLFDNGQPRQILSDSLLDISYTNQVHVLQMASINKYGYSHWSKPYIFIPKEKVQTVAIREGRFGAEATQAIRTQIDVGQAGRYWLNVNYSSAFGEPTIAYIYANSHLQGTAVMPSLNPLSSAGTSNMVAVDLLRGSNILELKTRAGSTALPQSTTGSTVIIRSFNLLQP